MMSQDTREEIEDLPPSAKLVLKVLEYRGSLTQKQIIEESMLSARTVRYALERLQEIGVVTEDIYFADARQSLYEVTDLPSGESETEQETAADGGLASDATDTSSEECSDGEACCAE
jgi:DNA-binding MarR family transcriptional regulator